MAGRAAIRALSPAIWFPISKTRLRRMPCSRPRSSSMSRQHYDLIVIGSGPSGQSAAINAVKLGKKAAVVCARPPGGNCTYLGTIPSKALRHCVKQVMQFKTNPMLQELSDVRHVTYQQLMRHTRRVVAEQATLRNDIFQRNLVPIFEGTGSFVDANTVQVVNGKN